MRRMLCTLFVAAAFATVSPLPAARAAPRDVQLITGSAPIKRGRVRRARGAATHRALLEAVWRWVRPRLASSKGHRKLRRQLSRRVRKLIQRYRTRKVTRRGRRLTVLLAVTVDVAAVKARLKALRRRLKQPGVLVVAHCAQGPLDSAVTAALRRAGVRVVANALTPQRRAALVQSAGSRPGDLRASAKAAQAAAVVVVGCRAQTLSRIVAGGVWGVRSKVVAEVYRTAGKSSVQRLLRVERMGVGHHADVKKAGYAALARALPRLARRLEQAVGPALPAGLTRTLMVRLRGAVDLKTLLGLARQLEVQLQGVRQVAPRRLARGVTWLAVRTVHTPGQLQQALSSVRPPSGWQLKASAGTIPGTVDLRAELSEEDP